MKKSTQWSDHFKSMPHLKIMKMKPATKPAIKEGKGQKGGQLKDIVSGLEIAGLFVSLPFLPKWSLLIAALLV